MYISYCNIHMTLVETLIKMQFIPSGGYLPTAAIHLYALKFCHVLKMINQVSNYGFAEALTFMRAEAKKNF